ncbi:MAG TPA: hypothetical protein VLA12_21685, partial [Planctomycetaceae bacterium]|nr:hypothetical protein [Planctomycetaceae bacterium]
MDDVTNRSVKSVAVGIGFLSLVLSSFLLFSPAKEITKDSDSVDADPVSLDISECFAGHPKDQKERNAIVSLSSKGAWISRVFDDGQECTSIFFLQDWSGIGNDLHLIDDLYNAVDLICPDDMTDEEFDALIRL